MPRTFYFPSSTEYYSHTIGEIVEENVRNIINYMGFDVINIEPKVLVDIPTRYNLSLKNFEDVLKVRDIFYDETGIKLPVTAIKKKKVPDIGVVMLDQLIPFEITGSLKYYLRYPVENGKRSHSVMIEALKFMYYSLYGYRVYLLSYYADDQFNVMPFDELVLINPVVYRHYYTKGDSFSQDELSFKVLTNTFKPLVLAPFEASLNVIFRCDMNSNYDRLHIRQIYYLDRYGNITAVVSFRTPVTFSIDVMSSEILEDDVAYLRDVVLGNSDPEIEYSRTPVTSEGFAKELLKRVSNVLTSSYGFERPVLHNFLREFDRDSFDSVLLFRKGKSLIFKFTTEVKRSVLENVTIMYNPYALVDEVETEDDVVYSKLVITGNVDMFLSYIEEYASR